MISKIIAKILVEYWPNFKGMLLADPIKHEALVHDSDNLFELWHKQLVPDTIEHCLS